MPGLLSRQRLRNELVKILGEENPLTALQLLKDLDALSFIDPALAFGPSLLGLKTARERLAGIAALMGPAGAAFLAGLKFSNKETEALAALAGTLKR